MSVKTRLSTILLFASNPCSECKVENNDLRASLYGNLDVDIEAQTQFNISSGNKVDEKRNDAEDGVHKFLELSEIPSSVCVKIRTWLSRAPCRSRIIRQADRKVQRRTTFTWLVSHPVTRPSPGRHRPGCFTRPTSCTSSLPRSSRLHSSDPTVFSFVYNSRFF